MNLELKMYRIKPEDRDKPKILQQKLVAYVSIHGDKDLVDAIRNELESRSDFWAIE